MNPLLALEACGQSPWLDFLKRGFILGGGLDALIAEDGLKGVTSNPSIFQKAIGDGGEYDAAIADRLSAGDASVTELYEHLAVADIQAAADRLAGVYAASHGRDGYVSLECSPYVADDADATVREALHLWAAVNRPNLMIKAPATPAGVAAVEALIARGVNVNVTLLFGLSAYAAAAEAYIYGLEALAKAGGDLSRIASVASFFISRIDAAVDARLDHADDPRAASLKGKIAVANAKMAYQHYKTVFSGPRWEALQSAGARPQRLLWASTSTKNPAYSDVVYVEALIGRDTVNTLPPATLEAFRDHGRAQADAVEQDVEAARRDLSALEAMGISLDEITQALLKDGVRQFSDAFDSLLASVALARLRALDGATARQTVSIPNAGLATAVESALEEARTSGLVRRLWAGDAGVWTNRDEAKWLGWLTSPARETAALDELKAFATEVQARGFTDVLLLGMGGSSLGPEVVSQVVEGPVGGPRFHMLDSTDPAEVRARRAAVDISRTLVITASKSGGTLEPNLFLDYFYAEAKAAYGRSPSDAFVAITDPGSALERRARDEGFWRVFLGDPAVGGRYSVLSRFGFVPAAALGLDLDALARAAMRSVNDSGPDAPPSANPAVRLGLCLGVAAREDGRDKVTFFTSKGVGGLAAWLEQLIAESTGKDGRGLIPVADEPIGAPSSYGSDRIFVDIRLESEASPDAQLNALEAAGHPVIRLRLKRPTDLFGEFFRWEIATAVAGAVIGINPFDQPDVEDSKIKTRALMARFESEGALAAEAALLDLEGVKVFADPVNAASLKDASDLAGAIRRHLARALPADYVAFLLYLERNEAHEGRFRDLRRKIRDKTGLATCVGFGPRFQHSTGQAYKGGPNTGLFFQVTATPTLDLPTPGRAYSFGVVEAAQAGGDLGALVANGRRAMRLHLDRPEPGLETLLRAFDEALS